MPDHTPPMFGGEDARWFILPDSPLGMERIKAFLTTVPVDLLPGVGGEEFLFYSRPACDAVGDVVAMVEKLRAMGSGAWLDASAQFRIQE